MYIVNTKKNVILELNVEAYRLCCWIYYSLVKTLHQMTENRNPGYH